MAGQHEYNAGPARPPQADQPSGEDVSAAGADPDAITTKTGETIAPAAQARPRIPGQRPGETPEGTYARQTRNATVFVAVCVGAFTVLALIGVIVLGVQAAAIKSQLQQINGTSTSNCMSQGGTNPNC